MLPEQGFQIFSLERVQQRFIQEELLDRFLACMKPASITIRLPSAGVFFILNIEIRCRVIAIFPYNIGFFVRN